MSQAVEKIDKASPERLDRLAEFDARMTAGLLAFGRDVAVGREHGDANWKARRTAPDLVAAVTKAADDPESLSIACGRRTRSTSRCRKRSTI